MTTPSAEGQRKRPVAHLDTVTIRFVGDSGDGMQLTGSEFMRASALAGNDLATFPDYPAEIRAPAGSLAGVSGYQVNVSSRDIHTPGDQPDVLVAMNPAALKTNLSDLRAGGMIIANSGAFSAANLEKAGYTSNPLEDEAVLTRYRVYPVDMNEAASRALQGSGLSSKDIARCRNFFALGLMYWLYSRPEDEELQAIAKRFSKKPEMAKANAEVFKAGFAFGEVSELFQERYVVPPSRLAPGLYRNVTGNSAVALAFAAAAHETGRQVFLGSYPITPASDILHEMAQLKAHGVVTFQAEDEIAGIGSAIGAAFGGALALTSTSGPGLALKSEMIGLAVMTELPLVIINVQRGGPSTGMPTKTEQSDLYIALFGRHGEAPLPVIAARSPSDCFWAAMEAMRVAVRFMTPVLLLTDGYLANGSEPFRVPESRELPLIEPRFQQAPNGPDGAFLPYLRDDRLSRPWAVPGTAGLEHRLGGLEKDQLTGMVSYDGANHEVMVKTRAQKVRNIADELPDVEVTGPAEGDLLFLSWGGTYGSVRTAVEELRAEGHGVAHAHLRWLNPFPKNLGALLHRYRRILVPEVNDGQLAFVVRGRFPGVDPHQFNRINGKPLKVSELKARALEVLS